MKPPFNSINSGDAFDSTGVMESIPLTAQRRVF
jgi:hypothetical protein